MKKRSTVLSARTGSPRRGVHIAVALLLLILVLFNMLVIFRFSSAGKEESGDLSEGVTHYVLRLLYPNFEELSIVQECLLVMKYHKMVRKAAHFCEFALLGLLVTSLLCFSSRHFKRLRTWITWVMPAGFTLLYAITDEIHQIFSNRGPRFTDVLIDFSGALCGVLFAHVVVLVLTHGKRETDRVSEEGR